MSLGMLEDVYMTSLNSKEQALDQDRDRLCLSTCEEVLQRKRYRGGGRIVEEATLQRYLICRNHPASVVVSGKTTRYSFNISHNSRTVSSQHAHSQQISARCFLLLFDRTSTR